MNIDTKNVSVKELKQFGLISSVIVIGLFGLLLPWLFNHSLPIWPWIMAIILTVWAISVPATLKPVYRIWMAIGIILGWINTRIILGILFFVVFLPAGLILRALGKDPMMRKLDKSSISYRVNNTPVDNKHVERPY